MKPKLRVIKIGGNIIEDKMMLIQFLKDFVKLKGPKILVHGGGKAATNLAHSMGLQPKLIDGRRITDADNLEVIVMTYAGLINKNIVVKLQQYNCDALGFTGADASIVIAKKREVKAIDYGYVGDVTRVDANKINLFLENNITPVLCAITHDGKGQLLNTNADTIASEVAAALTSLFEVELLYIFEKKGVLKSITDDDDVISHINKTTYQQLIKERVITDGMLPKIKNCFDALDKNVSRVLIGDINLIREGNKVFTTLSL
jgi:acetylglutamate kinase